MFEGGFAEQYDLVNEEETSGMLSDLSVVDSAPVGF